METAYRHSITQVTREIRTSGSMPVEVLCDDYAYYITKYASPDAYGLFHEYLANCFLRIWEIPTPEAAFVRINPEDISAEMLSGRRQRHHLERTCYGSKRLSDTKELDPSFLAKSNTELDRISREDFLDIALFDMWLSNEDRTANNHNLLLFSPDEGLIRFVAIDHVCVFNTGIMNGPLSLLTLEDSILYADYLKLMFPSSEKSSNIFAEASNKLYTCVSSCESQLPAILKNVLQDWNIDTDRFAQWAKSNLFTVAWLDNVRNEFLSHLQRAYTSSS